MLIRMVLSLPVPVSIPFLLVLSFFLSALLFEKRIRRLRTVSLPHLDHSVLNDMRSGWIQKSRGQQSHSFFSVFSECNESKAPTLSCVLISHDSNVYYLSELSEILFYVRLYEGMRIITILPLALYKIPPTKYLEKYSSLG